MLDHMERLLSATHNQRFLVDVLIFKALLWNARRRQLEALAALARAIVLAQPGRMVRPFLDASGDLDALLPHLRPGTEQADFLEQIRSERRRSMRSGTGVMPDKVHAGAPAAAAAPLEVFVQPQHPDLIELLTLRELQVLRLLAVRLTNKEIAHALGISVGTVKQHTRSVFSKLHADNRRDAIVQARSMGFEFDSVQLL